MHVGQGNLPWKLYLPALATGLLIMFLLVSLALTKAQRDVEQQFDIEAARAWQDVLQDFESSNEALEIFSTLYTSSIEVLSEQFQEFSQSILARHPFVYGIAYFPQVSADGKASFETKRRAEGYATFAITRRNVTGFEPVAAAARYFPAVDVAPLDIAHTQMLGFDVLSDPALAAAVQRAIDAAAPTLEKATITATRSGHWLFKAIYTGTAIPKKLAERRSRVNGVIAIILDPQKLLADAAIPTSMNAQIESNLHQATQDYAVPPPEHHVDATNTFAKRFNARFPGYDIGLTVTEPRHWNDGAFSLVGFAFVAGLGANLALLMFAHGISARAKEQAARASVIELEVEIKTRDLHDSNERTRLMIAHAMDAVISMNKHGRIIEWNARSTALFGWERSEALGRELADTIIPVRYREVHRLGLQQHLQGGEVKIIGRLLELAALHRAGHEFPIELSISSFVSAGEITFTAFIRDITQRKQAEERLESLANYDTLTGLANRALFLNRLASAIITQKRYPEKLVAVLFIDLDHFKSTNDTLGHTVGDRLLQLVTARITGCMRASAIVARLGGDEFTVIVDDITDPNGAGAVASHIIEALNKPFELDLNEIHISASIGVTICPDDGNTVEELLRNADTAMYQAKEQGRQRYLFFTPAMNQRVLGRALLERGLRKALERDEFLLYYQPKIDLRSGKVAGVEALIRWQHPEQGMVSPVQFITIAEETGLIVPIGEWVMNQACAQSQKWRQEGYGDMRMAVNISGRQFKQQDLVRMVEAALAKSKLDPKLLEVEITESVAMEQAEKAIATLHSLKMLGVRLSIDDFGTGYSSLSYLKRFPLDALKIDRAFVKDIGLGSDDIAIVRATIVMAHSLGLRVVAEGVETVSQLEVLKANGCDEAQGYYFCTPLPAAEFAAYFVARSAHQSGASHIAAKSDSRSFL